MTPFFSSFPVAKGPFVDWGPPVIELIYEVGPLVWLSMVGYSTWASWKILPWWPYSAALNGS